MKLNRIVSNFDQTICLSAKVVRLGELLFGITRSKDAFTKTIFIVSARRVTKQILNLEYIGCGMPSK